MTTGQIESFTRQAAAAVQANDRRARRRAFLRAFRRPTQLALLAWSALVFAGFVLVLLPMSVRMAG